MKKRPVEVAVVDETPFGCHRLLMERASGAAEHGVSYCGAYDTLALEPTRGIFERFRPELPPLAEKITGHMILVSSKKLTRGRTTGNVARPTRQRESGR